MRQRIQKILAAAGIASRRKSEEMIIQGKVKVNGRVAKIGESADETDSIYVNDKKIKLEKKVYILLNKPKRYITTAKDYRGRKTVTDLIKTKQRIFPVGRLDKDTEGVLLFTNDGDFANKLIHPRYEVEKEYEAKLDREFKDQKRIRKVTIDGRKINIRSFSVKGNKVIVKIHEGRKHIVKKLFLTLGYKVEGLKRTRFAGIGIGRLKPGQSRNLNSSEIRKLQCI